MSNLKLPFLLNAPVFSSIIRVYKSRVKRIKYYLYIYVNKIKVFINSSQIPLLSLVSLNAFLTTHLKCDIL